MADEIEVFLNKVDAFAHGLSQTEQAMLAYLVADDAEADEDEVVGFNLIDTWPTSVRDIAPIKIGGMVTKFDPFLSSGHTGNVVSGDGRINGDVGKGEI